MLILHIDSSSRLCSVSLARHGKEMAFEINSEPFSHGTDINVMIEKIMTDAGVSFDHLEGVSVNRGPGSFTALRIGMATAKGICYGRDLPMLAPDGMQILVSWAEDQYPEYDFYVPMIDARRMEVYTISPVSGSGEKFEYESRILEESSFQEWADQKVCFIGDGVSKWADIAPSSEKWKMVPEETDARKMIRISKIFSKENNFSDLFHVIPLYIKKPNITQSRKQYF